MTFTLSSCWKTDACHLGRSTKSTAVSQVAFESQVGNRSTNVLNILFCLKHTVPNRLGGFLIAWMMEFEEPTNPTSSACTPSLLGFCPDVSFVCFLSLSLRNGPRKEQWRINDRTKGGRASRMHYDMNKIRG